MNRKEAAELLPIIKAFSEGKTLQIRPNGSEWIDIETASFTGLPSEYRIKPEPKYRPFANAEECWNEMEKHQPFGWVKDRNGSKSVIENVDPRGFVEVFDEGTCNYGEVFDNRTFADGTPFGVKVEE